MFSKIKVCMAINKKNYKNHEIIIIYVNFNIKKTLL